MPAGHNGNRIPSAPPEAQSASDGGRTAGLATQVEELVDSASRLIEIYGDRRRLAVRRTVTEAAVTATLALCAAVWLCAAALATVRGLCASLGDLAGGALALALAAGGIWTALRVSARLELRRLERRHGRVGDDEAAHA